MRSLLARLPNPFDRPASHEASRVTIAITAVAAVAFFVAVMGLIFLGPRGIPGVKYYEVNAEFGDVAQITPQSQVRMLGRLVGQVTKVETHDGRPTLRLQLLPGLGPLASDTKARIRLKGILGGRYVDLTPGRSRRALPSGGTLPMSQTSSTVELLDVFQTLDGPRRLRLQSTLQGLGQGFVGRGQDVNEMLGAAPGLFGDLDQISSAVLRRQGAAARLFPSAESLARAYDPVREDLARGFTPEARVLGALADRRGALNATLDVAPSSLSALRKGLDASVPLLDQTAGLARAATRLTRPAPASLREATILLRQARPALRRSQPLLRATQQAVPPTLSFLSRIDPVIGPSTRALRSSIPPLREFGRRGCDYLTFGTNWRSGLGFGVPPGKGDPVATLDNTYPGVGDVLNSFRVTAKAPTDSESLNGDNPDRRIGTPFAADPYPRPCAAASEKLP